MKKVKRRTIEIKTLQRKQIVKKETIVTIVKEETIVTIVKKETIVTLQRPHQNSHTLAKSPTVCLHLHQMIDDELDEVFEHVHLPLINH